MKRFRFLLLIVLVAGVLSGCGVATQTTATATPAPTLAQSTATLAPQATAAPTFPALPTKILIGAPTPQVPPPIDNKPTPEGSSTVIADPTALKLVNEAKADLVTRANVLPDEITVKSVEPVEWRDSSLGCPMPGMMYLQVITPGYLIILEADGKEWEYHASQTHVVYCEK